MHARLLSFLILALPALGAAQRASAQLRAAQTPFVEGTLTYTVSLQPANGQEGLGTQAGTYTLTLKGGQVRRELRMNSGYQSTVLFDGNSGTGALLQATPDQRFAVQLSATDMAARRAPWEHYSFQPDGTGTTLADQACQPGRAVYANGTSVALCLGTIPLSTGVWLFSRFPGVATIPVQFDYRNRDGSTVRFRLEHIGTAPVEAAQFRVPADYKLLSAADLHDASE